MVGTLLSYTVEAQIGGKLAQLGQRLANGAAKKLADEFFKKFAASVSPQQSDSLAKSSATSFSDHAAYSLAPMIAGA